MALHESVLVSIRELENGLIWRGQTCGVKSEVRGSQKAWLEMRDKEGKSGSVVRDKRQGISLWLPNGKKQTQESGRGPSSVNLAFISMEIGIYSTSWCVFDISYQNSGIASLWCPRQLRNSFLY